jgi:hypothetical protein
VTADTDPRPPGRPRGTGKLTDETAEAILTAVEQGSYLKIAALAAGVSESTLHRWLADGAARDMLARMAPERWAGVTRVQMTTEETERRLDDAVAEALLALGMTPDADDELLDDDLPEETDEP